MMSGRKSDASIAFSVTDNLSQSIVGMKNSVNSFRADVTGLQASLDKLDSTRFQLKNFDLKNAKRELERTKQAFEELGEAATDAEREAAKADFQKANQNYENVRRQLDLVSKQARQVEKDMLDASSAISKADNRAGAGAGRGGASVLAALGKAGLGQMAGDAAQEVANLLIGSAFGDEAGGVLSSGLSGAISGAAMGSIIPGIGTAVGAAIGGGLGVLQGATQAAGSRDEAFKAYYGDLYEQGLTAADESLAAGSATAAQRELDAIAFNKLLGAGVGDQYLERLRALAAETPLEYADLTGMSRALATGFGDSPERMLELMRAIGDAGSAVGVSAADMEEMARAMSRMNSSGKATLEFLNIFQDRGVDVIGMLGEALGKSQGDIYSMISKGEINGQTAANIIQAGMESAYKGSMEEMAVTFSGLTSTLEDTMTEIDNARGEGYNAERSGGLQAEIDAYGGALGQAVESLNAIAGQNEAYLENLSEQYTREALSAVLLGETPSGIYGPEQQEELAAMREEYQAASEAYASGSQEAGLKMDSLRREAEALAKIAYESSEQYQTVHDTELDLIEAIRENTAALSGWRNGYNIQQALSKGSLVNLIGENSLVGQAMGFFSGASALVGTGSETTTGLSVEERQAGNWRRGGYYDEDGVWRSHAAGLERVPYDGYAALLHEGERVLTAREARQADQGGGAQVTITGNTFQVRQESDIDAIAEALYRRLRLAQMGGVR